MVDTKGVVRLGMPGNEKPKMGELNRFLTKYCKLWKSIGYKLGLEDTVLNNIQSDCLIQRECFTTTLQKWLEQDERPTWNTLELAITNARREELDLVPLEKIPSNGHGPRQDDDKSQEKRIPSQGEKSISASNLSTNFSSFVTIIMTILEKKHDDYNEKLKLCKSICSNLTIDDSDVLLFSDEQLDKINKCATFEQLFTILRKHWSWKEYSILKTIIATCESKEAEDELDKFEKLMSAYRGMELISEEGLPDGILENYVKLCIKIEKPYKSLTLQDFSELKTFIFEHLNVREYIALPFIKFLFSSLHLEWYIPMQAVSHIIKAVHQNKKIFVQKSIVLIKIGEKSILDVESGLLHSDDQQVCLEKHLESIAEQLIGWEQVYMYLDVTEPEAATIRTNYPNDYETQKIQILKSWKTKKGFMGTFKALIEVFSGRSDQRMIDVVRTVATKAYDESSEDSVIELLEEFNATDFEKLEAAAIEVGILTNTDLETFEDAANNVKKRQIILNALKSVCKSQLIHFTGWLATQGYSPRLIPPPLQSSVKPIEKVFQTTVRNIRKHLRQCNVQELVTNFNTVVNKEKFPNFKDRVKEKLYRCRTIGDIFARISPFYNWKDRKVLKALMEVSDCPEAITELKQFEAQLDYGQPAISFPIPSPSSDICPDPESDVMIVSVKSNQDLNKITLKGLDDITDTIVQAGKIHEGSLELQAKNPGSSILYWLLPKSVVKSFEENVRNNLDSLYDQGILEISLDPNIVITTGSRLRVRTLSYLTKLPPQDARPLQRAEELEELPTTDTKLPERAEEIVELAYQLKIDMQKREKEIVELDVKVQKLEKDKEEKEHKCNEQIEQLTETIKELKMKQVVQDTLNIFSQQHVNLSFGVRGGTAVTCGGKIYIGGGDVSKTSGAPDIIQIIDPTTQHVQCVSQLPPCPVKHFGLVCIDNQIVTVGGKAKLDDRATDQLYCWDEATQHWEQNLPPMSTPRYFHTSVMWNDYLIVCGGRIDNEESITDSVEILNLQSKCWNNTSSLPLKESGKHAVITDNGKLYLLGGYLGNAVHYCELHQLIAGAVAAAQTQEASLVWKRLKDTPSSDCAAVLLKGSLIIIGGRRYSTNKITEKVFRYSHATNEWKKIGDLRYNRTACIAVALDYCTVLVIGGTVLYDQKPEWFSASTEKIVSVIQ